MWAGEGQGKGKTAKSNKKVPVGDTPKNVRRKEKPFPTNTT